MAISPTQLLAQSAVRLFGWVVGEVDWRTPASAPKAPASAPKTPAKGGSAAASGAAAPAAKAHSPLLSPQSTASANAKLLANVLAFSHEGRYTQFRAPALFLMLDEGEPVWEKGKVDPARLGLAQLDQSMLFASDLKFWICDRSAYITRLDMSAGTVQLVVIDLETSGAQGRRIDLVGQGSSYMARLGQGTY
jgi:hypothetical protein